MKSTNSKSPSPESKASARSAIDVGWCRIKIDGLDARLYLNSTAFVQVIGEHLFTITIRGTMGAEGVTAEFRMNKSQLRHMLRVMKNTARTNAIMNKVES